MCTNQLLSVLTSLAWQILSSIWYHPFLHGLPYLLTSGIVCCNLAHTILLVNFSECFIPMLSNSTHLLIQRATRRWASWPTFLCRRESKAASCVSATWWFWWWKYKRITWWGTWAISEIASTYGSRKLQLVLNLRWTLRIFCPLKYNQSIHLPQP